MIDDFNLQPYKDYKITGIPSGCEDQIELGLVNDNFSRYGFDTGNGKVFNTGSWSHYRLRFDILKKGAVLNNVIIKPMITNNLNATYDDFVSFDNSLVTGINSGIKMDLLWQNYSTSSSFDEQTISLDLSEYKFVLISFDFLNSQHINTNNEIIYKTSQQQNVSYSSYDDRGAVSAVRVIKKVGDNVIDFGQCYYNGVNTTTCMIPTKIYGIK